MSPKKKNQHETIINAMQQQPEKLWTVSDFQKWDNFVWYKASARINELVQHGYIETAWREWRFVFYKITKKWLKAETIYALMRKEKNLILRATEWLFS